MNTCKWPLGNGTVLEFTIYNFNTTWNKVAGLYIFAYKDRQYWRSLYVGQTDDFSSRLPNHEILPKVSVNWGHLQLAIHALAVPLAANRDKWEKMLIQHLQPSMNTQYR